jgi:hypothetical protein
MPLVAENIPVNKPISDTRTLVPGNNAVDSNAFTSFHTAVQLML